MTSCPLSALRMRKRKRAYASIERISMSYEELPSRQALDRRPAAEGGCAIWGEDGRSPGERPGPPIWVTCGGPGHGAGQGAVRCRTTLYLSCKTGAACLSPVPCFHFGWLLSQFFERRCGSLPCKGQGFHMTVQGRGRTRQERQGAARYLFSLHVNRLL